MKLSQRLTIEFRGKVIEMRYTDGALAYRRLKVPKIERRHCNMHAFRSSREFGGYANSDLFQAMLARKLRQMGIGNYLDLNSLPEGVTVDESGFLAVATIEIDA